MILRNLEPLPNRSLQYAWRPYPRLMLEDHLTLYASHKYGFLMQTKNKFLPSTTSIYPYFAINSLYILQQNIPFIYGFPLGYFTFIRDLAISKGNLRTLSHWARKDTHITKVFNLHEQAPSIKPNWVSSYYLRLKSTLGIRSTGRLTKDCSDTFTHVNNIAIVCFAGCNGLLSSSFSVARIIQ